MKGTLKIATLFNIPVFLHWSFPLIFLYIIFLGNQIDAGIQGIACLSILFIIVFFCVVLHEYGHALTARRYGVKTRDIILSPIGGVARLERIPSRPIEEFKVAIAGPAVNVVIALILLPLVYFLRKDGLTIVHPDPLVAMSLWQNLAAYVLGTNVMLVLFNMIPAFPMDGGRVLRALLARKMDRVKATKIAYIVAQFCALGFIVYGIISANYIVFAIAIFVIFTSRFEWKNVEREGLLKGKTVNDVMLPISAKLYRDQSIQEAIDHTHSEQDNFLVFNRNEKVVGVLFGRFIQHAVKENDLISPVEKYRSNTWEEISNHYPLDNAIALFQQRGYGIVPIMDQGELVGQLDMKRLNAYVQNL